MGQHKTNPVALAAKRGELPPISKQENYSQAELQLLAYNTVMATFFNGFLKQYPKEYHNGKNRSR